MAEPPLPSCLQFLKKTLGVKEDDPQGGLKSELKQLFTKLCNKLDALSNFHYTPKAIIPEIKVGVNCYVTLHFIMHALCGYTAFVAETFRNLGSWVQCLPQQPVPHRHPTGLITDVQ